jgi:hypothetical protein
VVGKSRRRLAGRLWRFDLAIDADRALYALSMLTSAAISIGDLDEPDQGLGATTRECTVGGPTSEPMR